MNGITVSNVIFIHICTCFEFKQFCNSNDFIPAGPNNRFNRSIPNKNGRFASKTFAHRRNLTRVNVKKEPAKFGDEDCILRNILPFQGTGNLFDFS